MTTIEARTPVEAATATFAMLRERDLSRPEQIWAADAVDHFLAVGSYRGRGAIAGYFRDLFSAFPDLVIETERICESGADLAVVQWHATGTFTGLTPGTRYFGGVVAVDAAGNRSSVVPFEFTTLRSIDGTYNYTVTVTASNVGYADFTVAQDCDIDNDRSRVPAYERGERVEIDIEMTEESQSLEFIGYTLPGVLLRRRVE